MLAYTFADWVPGFSASSVYNTTPYAEIINRPLENANSEGRLFFGVDYVVEAPARAKVAGDIFEIVSSAVMWNAAALWNEFMVGGRWTSTRLGYSRPATTPVRNRQVAVLNLPRDYDWVDLLVAEAKEKIALLRGALAADGLHLPTSTPDMAVVALPERHQEEPEWRTELRDIGRASQDVMQQARRRLEGEVEPGEILLAVAFKKSLRSDRLYQPLYEANIMQLLLEGHLSAPKVEFEVHTLEHFGTDARHTYEAASLYSVLTDNHVRHRAVRELYVPVDAQQLARRLLTFLDERTALIPAL
jgi:hypothetical protein